MSAILYTQVLGNGRFVKVSQAPNTETVVEISESGSKPKGHTLTLQRWKMLCDGCDPVNELIYKSKSGQQDSTLSIHLGGNVFISINAGYQCVNIRQFENNGNCIFPTKDGIALRFTEWNTMIENMALINQNIPYFDTVFPCYMDLDHCNQLGFLRCPECNPTSFTEY